MPRKEIFRITKGKGFKLADFDPGDTRGLRLDKGEAAELLQRGTEWLAEEQDMMPRIAGRCCSCSRRWTRPARMAPLNTSCRE
jgi:hypothetical protein